MRFLLSAAMLVASSSLLPAQTPADPAALEHSVEQLRSTVGTWSVVTDFLQPDGTVGRSGAGTYQFAWVVPNRVLAGVNDIPALQQKTGILFYINESKSIIEMVAVGADGTLWIMTGPLGGETRYTQEFGTANGGTGQLRFTRYNVSADAFESKMEHTEDGGATWNPGNHQQFRRAPPPTR
jgi:hypothetical protein